MTDPRDSKLVYYGPHPCQKCDPEGVLGTLIVKTGNGASDELEFDFDHNSHYPNHTWKQHVCSTKNRRAQVIGSSKTPKKASSSRINGKKGGRPRKTK